MATIRNPQQAGLPSREDTKIEGARDMEDYHFYGREEEANPLPVRWKARTARRGGILPNTGGCLNPPTDVLLTERETQPGLPFIER
jgi:hypothetical protein